MQSTEGETGGGGDGGGSSDEPTTEPEPEPETEPGPEPEATPSEELDKAGLTEEPPVVDDTCQGGPPGTDGCPPAADTTELPKCDGTPQDCTTRNGDICKAGEGGEKCECLPDMSDCPNHPSLIVPPVTEPREPLPYCDLIPRGTQEYSCHDRRDYDDITGLYPCNDGTQKEHFLDCPDVSGADYEEFKNQPPIDPCLLDPDNSPTCPPPVDGKCPEGYAMNESGKCFPRHERCPTGYHSHEDDESGRCIPDSTPCDEGYTRDPDFPTCSREHFTCDGKPSVVKCEDDDEEHIRVIIKNINIHKTIHNTADFPEVDIIGLSVKDTGEAMVCMMNIDNDWVQCQEFGVPADRINQNIWRIIETDSDKDYDNGNTGSDDVDNAIDAIKAYDFAQLDDLDNHDFNVDLAALGINPKGEGLVCLVEDDRNEGTALCEPFKIASEAVTGQITEITEISS